MPKESDRTLFQRLYEMGEDRVNTFAEEMLSNPRFAEMLGTTLQKAMETKGKVDRNMQTVLGLLNVPSRADFRKLSTKVEALQGSLVNLNIKLDRILAAQGKPAKPKRPSKPAPPRSEGPPSQ